MATFVVATMDTASGWETQSVPAALSRHVAYWFTAKENQGKVMGKVPSFEMLFKQYSHLPEQMVEQTKMQFKAYLEELFPNVAVNVQRQNLTGETNNYRLILSARVSVDGHPYDLAQTVSVSGELFKVLEAERLKR